MVEINASLFIQIANFLILIWALNKFLYKPIRLVLYQRKSRISGLEDGIKQNEQDMVKKDQALKMGLKEAREKGMKQRDVFENEARLEEMKLIEKINEKARADLAEIREKVSKEAQSARKSLEKEIDNFSDQISRKILGRSI
ncbi:MAG: ATP synthase F0 subunit B [Desulfobacterales bacterium]|jgi:F-type H+-transporting ATPase subunit b|nr:ATP synthase F0 subunit B [Desulfobacterales bacterium]